MKPVGPDRFIKGKSVASVNISNILYVCEFKKIVFHPNTTLFITNYILQVNGIDFSQIAHNQAVELLKSTGNQVSLFIERDTSWLEEQQPVSWI